MPTIVFQSAPKTIIEAGDNCFIQVDRIAASQGDVVTLYRTANGKPDGRQSFQTVMPLVALQEIVQLIGAPTEQSIFPWQAAEVPASPSVDAVDGVALSDIDPIEAASEPEPIQPDMGAMDATAIVGMSKAEMLHLAHQVKTPEDDVDIDSLKKPELAAWLLQKVAK